MNLSHFAVGAALLSATAAAQTPIFGLDLRQDRFFTTDTGAFVANFRSLGPYTGNHFAFDFAANGVDLWGVTFSTLEYGVFDVTTGAFTVVGTLTGPPATSNVSGIASAPDGATWYLSEIDSLGNSNLWVGDITTGVFSLVGEILAGTSIIDISVSGTNDVYGLEIGTDNLVRIDPATGAGTLVGPIGANANFAQGMDFDWSTNVLYATVYTGGGTGNFATIDLATGAATVVDVTTPLNAEMEMSVRVPAGMVNINICNGTANSAGLPARMQVTGSSLVAQNNVFLTVHNLPLNSAGYFLNTPDAPFTVPNPGGSQGDLCIASFNIGRHVGNILNSGTSGAVSLVLDLTQLPQPNAPVPALAGSMWCWQYWYRDVDPVIGVTSNFSNARRVIFF